MAKTMVTTNTNNTVDNKPKDDDYSSSGDLHELSDAWILWAHLPHDTDWSIKSYIKLYTFDTVEQAITITEMLPHILVTNCMLFLMRKGISPIWEDERNRNGGCFSYKIPNKCVYEVWKDLSYVLVGESISSQLSFVTNVTGITISPKKNFCIIKIWMSTCANQNPNIITNEINGLTSQGCLFKKHTPEY